MKDFELREVRTGYGQVEIVRGVTASAKAGEITCIFGPNGSGKSTFLKTVAGVQPIWSGDILYGGESVRALLTEERIRLGIAAVPQSGSVFPDLTVDENLLMGGHTIRDRKRLRQRVEEIYTQFPSLKSKRKAKGGDLSGGQRMLVSVGQLLMTDPDFLLLDEPSAGLSPNIVKDVFALLAQLKAGGKGVLMVEQNVRDALTIADRIYILVQGRLAYEAARTEVPDIKSLMDVYMQA